MRRCVESGPWIEIAPGEARALCNYNLELYSKRLVLVSALASQFTRYNSFSAFIEGTALSSFCCARNFDIQSRRWPQCIPCNGASFQ